LPWTCVLAATGNNLTVEADTIRRVVPCRIEPGEERPAERGGYRIPDLLAHARAHRPALLAAALTVVRGYITAGRPDQNLSHFGSFEQWSGTVRAAVRWSMGTDPLDTREGLVTTGGVDEVARLFEALAEIPGISQGLTSRQIVATLKAASANNELEAARDLVGEWAARGNTLPSEVSIGKHLSRFVGRIAGGRQLQVKTDRRNTKVWAIKQVGEIPPPVDSEPPSQGSEIPEYAEAAF
jgi:putative DNA primase/helicase